MASVSERQRTKTDRTAEEQLLAFLKAVLVDDELLQLAQVLADQALRLLHAVGTAAELDQLGELQIHLLHLAEIVALQHENLQQRRYSSPCSLASTRQIPLRRVLERVLPHIDAIQVRHARHAQHFALREAVLPQSQRLALPAAAHLQDGAHGARAVLDLHVLHVAAHDLQLLHALERVLGDRQRAAARQICEEAPRNKEYWQTRGSPRSRRRSRPARWSRSCTLRSTERKKRTVEHELLHVLGHRGEGKHLEVVAVEYERRDRGQLADCLHQLRENGTIFIFDLRVVGS